MQENQIWHGAACLCVCPMCGQDSKRSCTQMDRQIDRSNGLVLQFVTAQALLNPVPFVCVGERERDAVVRKRVMCMLLCFVDVSVLAKC